MHALQVQLSSSATPNGTPNPYEPDSDTGLSQPNVGGSADRIDKNDGQEVSPHPRLRSRAILDTQSHMNCTALESLGKEAHCSPFLQSLLSVPDDNPKGCTDKASSWYTSQQSTLFKAHLLSLL